MRKLLSIFIAFILAIASISSVVSCGPQVETEVLFLMPGIAVASSYSASAQAYNQIIEDFNQTLSKDEVRIKPVWEANDAVQDRISSFQQLPDLYVAYPDAASQYVYGEQRDDARLMLNSQSDVNLRDKFWTDSFYQEGLIKDNLYVLPVNKAFNFNVINLRLLYEIARHFGISLSFDDWNINHQVNGVSYQPLFTNIYDVQLQQDFGNTPIVKKLNSLKSKDDVRELFLQNQNVLDLTTIFVKLYQNALDQNAIKKAYAINNQPLDEHKIYANGLDDVMGKIYLEYADYLKLGAIDPTKNNFEFLYNVDEINADLAKMDIVLDSPSSLGFTGTKQYFNTLNTLAIGDKKNSDPSLKWSGSLLIGKLDGKTYTSNIFVQSTMLASSTSSSGTAYFDSKNNQYDKNYDLIAAANSTRLGNHANFISQGAGIAGFKSVGKNAKQKEVTVTKFLDYILKDDNLNRLAIMSGFIPSTKWSLSRYVHYKDGLFDNLTGKWNSTNLPIDSETYQSINKPFSNTPLVTKDLVITDFLNNYILNDFSKTKIVITTGNPAGQLVWNGIVNASNYYIFKDMLPIEQLLAKSNDRSTLYGQIKNNFSDFYSNSTIKFR